MLTRFFPYYGAPDHVLFYYPLRYIRWASTKDSFRRSSLRYFLRVFTVMAILFTLGLLLQLNDYNRCTQLGNTWCSQRLTEFAEAVTFLTLFISIGLSWVIDFAAIISALGSYRADFQATYWDLLRISSSAPALVISAKHALTKVRTWRTTLFIISLRITVCIFAMFSLAILRPLTGNTGLFEILIEGLTQEFILVVVLIFCGVVGGIFYLVEPLLRSDAMSALALAVVARFRNTTSSIMAGLASIFLVWLGHAIAYWVIMSSWIKLMEALADWASTMDDYELILPFSLVLLVFLLIGAIAGSFWLIKRYALRYAARISYKQD